MTALQIQFGFFRLTTDAGRLDVARLYDSIDKIVGGVPTPSIEHAGSVYVLTSLSTFEGGFKGDTIRIEMDNLPIVAAKNGSVTPFDLEDDEGIGERAAFCFFSSGGFLVLEKRRTATSISRLCELFDELLTACDSYVIAEPLLRRDALERFAKLSEVRKIEFSFASPTDMEAVSSPKDTVLDSVRKMKDLGANSIGVTISAGRSKNGLKPKSRNLISRLLGEGAPQASKIRVSGRTDNKTPDLIDFIEERITSKKRVRTTNRRISFETRIKVLRESWEEQRREIESTYGS